MYELTQLFWYKSIFMTELLLSEALFVSRLKFRGKIGLRLTGGVAVCYAVAAAFPLPFYNAAYCSFMFLCFFLVTAAVIAFCCRESVANVLFCAIAGYTIQHIAFVFYDLIVNAAGLTGDSLQGIYSNAKEIYAPFQRWETALIYLCDYIIVYWSAFMIFGRRIKRGEDMQVKSAVVLAFVFIMVVLAIVLRAVVTYYEYDVYNRFYVIMLCVFSILCCVITLCFQFEQLSKKKLENEMAVLNQLLAKAKEQYAMSKDNIEMINLKCHDLKHQIKRIGSESAIDGAALREMENTISIYDAAVKTGNEALDIILTEKSLYCRKNGIALTCIADGARLDFIRDTDIYSLFGNALDNAIEAVLPLPADERSIGVTVRKISTFLSINVHNYYDKELVFESGLPKTTKSDGGSHGYGMKSIRLICERYAGDLSVSASGRVFNLNILFPLGGEK